MKKFKIGERIICTHVSHYYNTKPELGKVYTVKKYSWGFSEEDRSGLWVEEISRASFNQNDFERYDKREMIEEILK
jgi:hypothetical protein